MNDVLIIGVSLALIACCSLISLKKGHLLQRDLLISSFRTILQLLALGYVLKWIFEFGHPALTAATAIFMTVNSALHSRSRIKSKHPGLFVDNLMATVLAIWPLALLGSSLLTEQHWWDIQVLIPLLGMLLGNTLNGISVGVDQFSHSLREKKDEVISWLAIGASKDEATRPVFNRSLRLAMTPTINSMLSMGLVTIPGMMTGQLLAGEAPTKAAVTQILIMLFVASGAYIGTCLGLYFSKRKLFNKYGQPCF